MIAYVLAVLHLLTALRLLKLVLGRDISGDDDEDCISYERRPMYLCTEASYRILSTRTIKLLTGE